MDDGALMPKLVLYHLCPLKHSWIRNPKAACIVELCFFFEGKSIVELWEMKQKGIADSSAFFS